MLLHFFSTEFPLNRLPSRGEFISQVVTWLNGTTYSKLLSSGIEAELDTENAQLKSENGEELRFRELIREGVSESIGFRHDLPDENGRLWRTEAVVRRCVAAGEPGLIRLRTQCLAREPGIRLEFPRKPYFIKALLKDDWGGHDGSLVVTDQPIYLPDDANGLAVAAAVTLGRASECLPTVYISSVDEGCWHLSTREIEKLAYDLGGVAHVLVEPGRKFSFRLRDETAGANSYGGAIGLGLPERGIVRRYYIGGQILSNHDLAIAVRDLALRLRTLMPTNGWDWTELQEQALICQRLQHKRKLKLSEIESIYQEEIKTLNDRISQLKQKNSSISVAEAVGRDDEDYFSDDFIKIIGPEIYPGEILDRLRLAAKMALDAGKQIGIDSRSKAIFERILGKIPATPALGEFLQDLNRATRDSGRIANELTSLLSRHGYSKKSENKHIRLEAKSGYDGLDTITIPKTPSDNRGLDNAKRQVKSAMGITKLKISFDKSEK